MRALAVALAALGLVGCGGELPRPADPCEVPRDWSVGYMQCDSQVCVAGCGVLPPDGSPGYRLANGCSVQVGTSDTHTVLCVESCQECH